MGHPATGTRTLAQLLGTATGAGSDGKLYKDAPPDPVTYPYGLIRWSGSLPLGDDGGFQLRASLELELFGYPRSQRASFGGVMLNIGSGVSAMADVVEEAWRDYVATSVNDTIVAKRMESRITVPYTEPADRELVLIRLILPLYSTPAYQAQYTAPHA